MTTSATNGFPAGRRAAGPLHARHVLILHPRDPRHPEAAGPERYLHHVATRWAADGVQVTWLAERPDGLAERETLGGVRVVRGAGHRGRAARRTTRKLLVDTPLVDAVLLGEDARRPRLDRWPRSVPAVRVVHDPAAVPDRRRRFPGERWVAVSPSVRRALLASAPAPGPVFVVPPGADDPGEPTRRRAERPTVVTWLPRCPDTALLALWHLAAAAAVLPALRVDVVGEAPHLPHVRRVAHEHGLAGTVTFHGAVAGAPLTDLLTRAWLVLAAPGDTAWSYPVVEAATAGVPTLAPASATARDAVVDGLTGWVTPDVESLGGALTQALQELAVDERAGTLAAACRQWAGVLRWDRTADLLAGVLGARLDEVADGRTAGRRTARPTISAVATVRPPAGAALRLRVTDEVRPAGTDPAPAEQVVLLHGCDEADAHSALHRQGAHVTSVRLATDLDLLAGPGAHLPSTGRAIPAPALGWWPQPGLEPWPAPPPPAADGLNGVVQHA
ncbi:glycosyltransferase [Micromonospora sp. B11E3]|uniref:glycosyltransferase n=1 Tax=Micromonospora sp. B11E3 TaxID=3153562 RepID=UPI00325E6AFC